MSDAEAAVVAFVGLVTVVAAADVVVISTAVVVVAAVVVVVGAMSVSEISTVISEGEVSGTAGRSVEEVSTPGRTGSSIIVIYATLRSAKVAVEVK